MARTLFLTTYRRSYQYAPAIETVHINASGRDADIFAELKKLRDLGFQNRANIALKITGQLQDTLAAQFESQSWIKRLSSIDVDASHLTQEGFNSLHRVIKSIPQARYQQPFNFTLKVTNQNNATKAMSDKLMQHHQAKKGSMNHFGKILGTGLMLAAAVFGTLFFGAVLGGFFGFVIGVALAALSVGVGKGFFEALSEYSASKNRLAQIESSIPDNMYRPTYRPSYQTVMRPDNVIRVDLSANGEDFDLNGIHTYAVPCDNGYPGNNRYSQFHQHAAPVNTSAGPDCNFEMQDDRSGRSTPPASPF